MITISKLISRSDKEALASKVPDVNIVLKQFCKQRTQIFIDHSNISAIDHLNRSGLHLNKGLAQNFITSHNTKTSLIMHNRLPTSNLHSCINRAEKIIFHLGEASKTHFYFV